MTLLSELNVKVHIDIAIVLNETPKHPSHDAVVYTSTSCSYAHQWKVSLVNTLSE